LIGTRRRQAAPRVQRRAARGQEIPHRQNHPTRQSADGARRGRWYNERPTWLDLAHRKLDTAVFAAYGWKSEMSDDELLAALLALNLERAKGEDAGVQP
jgi:hypothetical protein